MKNLNLLFLLILTSCASYQSGNKANVVGSTEGAYAATGDVNVTGFLDEELSTKYFSYIQVEFGNNTGDWIDVDKVQIKYEGDLLKIVIGPRLNDWSRAIQNKIEVDRLNRQTILGVLAIGAAIGTAAQANSGNYKSARVNAAATLGLLAASDVNELSDTITDLERAELFPETHLYNSFSLPPGLVNKRWILIQHPEEALIERLVFEVTYDKKDKKTYSTPISRFN